MHILHAAFPQALDIVVGNVHAAGKTDVVADQHLAVIAQIDAQIGGEELGRQEKRGSDAPRGELLPGFAPGVERADAVHQYAHVHAARGRRGQGFGKGRAHLAGIEDVGSQKNVVPCRRDGLKHGRIGLVAVAQRTERIAAAEVLVRQAAAQMRHAGNIFRHLLRRLHGAGRMGVFGLQGGLLPHDLVGPALGPADAEKCVKQRPQYGQEQGRGGPAQGRARVSLGQQRMADRHPGEDVDGQQAQSFQQYQHKALFGITGHHGR